MTDEFGTDLSDPKYVWAVSATARPGDPGSGIVDVRLTNGLAGTLPPFSIAVDWPAGLEAVDVEMRALAMMACSFEQLSRACDNLIKSKSRHI